MKSSALQVVFYLWGKCLTSNIFFTNSNQTQKNLVFALSQLRVFEQMRDTGWPVQRILWLLG